MGGMGTVLFGGNGDGPFVSVPVFHFYLILIMQQIFSALTW
jgi:hypothetical protein